MPSPVSTPVSMFHDKHYFKRPVELPAGFLEVVQPLAAWMMTQLVHAYDDGYCAGRMDAERLEVTRLTSSKS